MSRRVASLRFQRDDEAQQFAGSVVSCLREPIATMRTRKPVGGEPEPEGAPRVAARSGYRIRPADPDQDPDPEDSW